VDPVSANDQPGADILVVNAGSSSLKLRVIGSDDRVVRRADLNAGDDNGLAAFVESGPALAAVAHRIVHGGPELCESVRIDAAVLRQLSAATDLAPLHNPPALAAIAAVQRLEPDVPAIVCFDTAFHTQIPDSAKTYPIPREWTARWGIRRYGFHGLSHAYAARRAAELLGRPPAQLRIVTCHLGAGASLCAVAGDHSIDTTMGFTPLEGLMMATRSGTVDPGMLFWLVRTGRLSVDELENSLEQRGGLAGVAEVPGGAFEEVQRRADLGDERASLALAIYGHRLRGGIAAMVASLGGLDVLAFTGGVGERAWRLREETGHGLAFLGVRIDHARNRAVDDDDSVVSGATAPVDTVVVRSREDLEMVREVRRVLTPDGSWP
jgi:acetate kinase